ncbi:dihydrofolate reductase [Bacillus taeanensis]|uniref:Dihydrofolate reductase n=1 Tax=Bacillus taeanensis TaxID=273032 RepID=A0A366XWG1_9BACI|nr:dihydrofolate reductase [Bacillus taeanensis]RBW69495.1 dihydrofolate reductase [Bacillus taeanensis]
MISLIWAMGQNQTIGKDNDMPWHLPADLAYFKKVTSGHTVLMGRKTHESIGRPLPNRKNIIITNNKAYKAEGCIVVHSVKEALTHTKEDEVFVIGGAQIYEVFLPFADRLYVTHIKQDFDGDAFFPLFDLNEWMLVSEEQGIKSEKNPYHYKFLVYEKNLN